MRLAQVVLYLLWNALMVSSVKSWTLDDVARTGVIAPRAVVDLIPHMRQPMETLNVLAKRDRLLMALVHNDLQDASVILKSLLRSR